MERDDVQKVLIVDDDPAIVRIFTAVLRADYVVEAVGSGEEAVALLPNYQAGVVLLDLILPGIDGFETCRRLKATPAGQAAQIIVISGKSSKDDQLRAYNMKADDYIAKPVEVYTLCSRVRLHFQLRENLLRTAAIRGEIESQNLELRRIAEQRAQEITATQDMAVFTLAKVAESRDQETGGHLLRMREYSQILAEELHRDGPYSHQIDQQFLDDLYRSSPLHDIGKVGIRDEILLKPGKLTPQEFAVMRQHATIGANILDQAVLGARGGGFLTMAALIARLHHERFDGSGYPAGLRGEMIPLPARIVALADVYDALTSARPYKRAFSSQQSREIIEAESGRQFDPVIVDAFRARFEDFCRIQANCFENFPVSLGAMAFCESPLGWDLAAGTTSGTGVP
ncbi:MAG: HD domain-containing phosphohydrolase [Thermoguttaceae bacterium]